MFKQCFMAVNGSCVTKGIVQIVEGRENQEVLNDVEKLAEEKAVEDLVEVRIKNNDPSKFFLLGSSLSNGEWQEIMDFLVANLEVFTWTPYDMPDVNPSFICHQLNVFPSTRPVMQRTQRSTFHHAKVVVKEV